jgi:predicted negative regulator of RcsB-dependent stress response
MMSIEDLKHDAATMTSWQRHRFFTLIAGVIIIAAFLVSIGLSLYKLSGAEQVDLSRPGYQSIRKDAQRGEDANDTFPSTGTLDDAAFATFYTHYDKRASRVVDVQSFYSKALSEESLQLVTPDGTPDTAQ